MENLQKHITWKDILYVVLLIVGFAMHWQAFSTRLEAVEIVINGSGQQAPIQTRMATVEQAVIDIKDDLNEIKNELRTR